MKIDYKVFDNGTAAIISRTPALIPTSEEVYISFRGCPENVTTAILEIDGQELYRPISGGMCAISAYRLIGEIKVTLAALGDNARPETWKCEELLASVHGGNILLSPNDMNLPERYVELKEENDEIRATVKALTEEIETLRDRFEKMLEGYNLV